MLALSITPSVLSYTYCGAHDRQFEMRVYYFHSEFWVDILQAEALKWNHVHSVLSLNRERRATFPAALKDGQNVVGWMGEADLMRVYNTSWQNSLGTAYGWTFARVEKNCGRMLEADLIFNPAITQFSPQTETPYLLGFQEVALHELGHVLTLGHEERGLSLMSAKPHISDVLHHNEKVGWYRSARQRFNPLPAPIHDMGVFPLRKGDDSEIFANVSPGVVSPGESVTIEDFSVENLSSEFPVTQPGPRFRVLLENVSSGASTEIGWFAWDRFEPFSSWSGSLTYTVPASMPRATYRVVAVFDGKDVDETNDRAVFGNLDVL